MLRSLALLALSLALTAGLFAAPAPKAKPDAPVTCYLSGDEVCESGKPPKVAVKLTNTTKVPLVLIHSLDGSDCKMRYPHVYFEVRDEHGRLNNARIMRCGNTNRLREQDFVTVKSGASFDPYNGGEQGAHQLAQKLGNEGKFLVRFHYCTEAPKPELFGATPRSDDPLPADIARLLDRVPKVTLTSNEITIVVKKK